MLTRPAQHVEVRNCASAALRRRLASFGPNRVSLVKANAPPSVRRAQRSTNELLHNQHVLPITLRTECLRSFGSPMRLLCSHHPILLLQTRHNHAPPCPLPLVARRQPPPSTARPADNTRHSPLPHPPVQSTRNARGRAVADATDLADPPQSNRSRPVRAHASLFRR